MHNTATLGNGLRIIHETATTANVYCGIIIKAGTADEDDKDLGLAHFCEHTTFKGTARRQAHHIRTYLDGCGADLNAYTAKEETCYYTAVPAAQFRRAVDLLTDIVFHSTYPQRELDKEKKVIADEIDSYLDSPAELIYDEFERIIFEGHPLGRDILGTVERLEQYTTDDALRFARQYYQPANATFYVLGNLPFGRITRILERATRDLQSTATTPRSSLLAPLTPTTITQHHDTHQAHVLIGNRSYPRGHSLNPALTLCNSLLGGSGMNTLLGVALREHRGLVYTVYSSVYTYTPAGIWTIYYGCDEQNINRCHKLIMNQLDRLCNQPIGRRKLQAAKQLLCSQLLLSQDHLGSHALAMGKRYAFTNQHRDINTIIEQLQAVTPEQTLRAAQEVFNPAQLTTLVYK